MDPSTTPVYYFRLCLCVLAFAFLSPLSGIAQDYFQQQVDYTIIVRLDDATHTLHAQEDFTYTNNSSVPLDTIWIHLWPNAYKDRGSALCKQLTRDGDLDLHFAKEEERGWIDSLDFSANEKKLAWGYHPEHKDIAWLLLSEPLRPNDSITISTPFRVQIPDGKFSRLGHTGEAYYITQWYPKPAVFDAQGWHTMPYLSSGEFYSEFGSFDVTITLPENYVVGATGTLQTAEEKVFMDRLAAIVDTSTTRGSNAIPTSSSTLKTIRFTQDKVHDFAWFADKRFIVRKSEVALPKSGRKVTTWALFTPRNKNVWAKGVNYVDRAVLHYSEHVGEYPYNACTAVDGTISAGGGMEYPMITIINSTSDAQSLDNVITHEVGHNWFYGILGSNERDHAWMDEGMNSFVELLYMRKYYPNGQLAISIPFLKKTFGEIKDIHHFQSEMGYRLNARRNLDQPLSLTSNDFTETNYGTMVYMKTALVMDHLMACLGEETMDRCLSRYYDTWKFKHPLPKDIREVFEKESGKDLGWVFDGLIVGDRKVDVKAKRLRGDKLSYKVDSKGLFAFSVTAFNGKDTLGSTWEVGGSQFTVHSHYRKTDYLIPVIDRSTRKVTLPWPNADRIRIDANNRTLDIDRRNNEVRSKGLCKRGHFPKFEPFIGLERNDRRSIYYAPTVAWNGHDGFQAGLVLHNYSFPSKRTEWVVAPLYGFGSERIGGAARIEHHSDRMQSRLFQNITLGLSGRMASTYHDADLTGWYRKLSPYITFDLKQEPLVKSWKHAIDLRSVIIWTGYTTSGTNVYDPTQPYGEITYRARNTSTLFPSAITPLFTFGKDFTRLSLDVHQGFIYNKKKDQFRIHAFAGAFISKQSSFFDNRLNAWQLSWGSQDLLYDHAFLERGAVNGVTGAQFVKQQGAFKTPFRQGGSDSWIGAINAELDLPLPIPISLFASAGIVPTTTITQEGKTNGSATYYEAGVGIQLLRDAIEVWFPFVVSKRIQDEEDFAGRQVTDRIRFVFALEKLDPTKLLRRLKP